MKTSEPIKEVRLPGELTQREKLLLQALLEAGYHLQSIRWPRQIVRKAA